MASRKLLTVKKTGSVRRQQQPRLLTSRRENDEIGVSMLDTDNPPLQTLSGL